MARLRDGAEYHSPDEARERGEEWAARPGEAEDLSDPSHYQTQDEATALGREYNPFESQYDYGKGAPSSTEGFVHEPGGVRRRARVPPMGLPDRSGPQDMPFDMGDSTSPMSRPWSERTGIPEVDNPPFRIRGYDPDNEPTGPRVASPDFESTSKDDQTRLIEMMLQEQFGGDDEA